MDSYKIYIVEDMAITRATLSSVLTRNNHIIIGSAATAEKAWLEIENLQPELVLIDFNLRGNKNGLWLAKKIKTELNIPFIFITAYGSDDILNKITEVESFGYIMKPFNNATILANVQLAIKNFRKIKNNNELPKTANNYYLLKTKTRTQKVEIDKILYLQSQGNFVTLFLKDEQLTCRTTLSNLLIELNNQQIQRTHRRYAINVSKITSIYKNTLFINEFEIPVSKTYETKINQLFEYNL